jgi:hypothetical protein
MSGTSINWEEVVKKKARGLDDADLGEVQEVHPGIVVIKKGIADKDRFYFPQTLVDRYDGYTLLFKISKTEAEAYRHP